LIQARCKASPIDLGHPYILRRLRRAWGRTDHSACLLLTRVGVGNPRCPARGRSAELASREHLVHVWSTRHRNRAVHNGLQRSPAARRSRRPPVQSWGNRPRGRTLIRMRSQVQVLAGPPAYEQAAGHLRPPAPDITTHFGSSVPAACPIRSVAVPDLSVEGCPMAKLRSSVGCDWRGSPGASGASENLGGCPDGLR
jgi:hypothetical protein